MSFSLPSRLAGITHASDLRAEIEHAVLEILAQAKIHPPALVLTGSLARDEATFLSLGPRWRLLGDAEFMMFSARRRELPSPERLRELARRVTARLAGRGMDAKIEISAATVRYLNRMPPCQFGFELRRHGRVLLGQPRLLQCIPRFSRRQLPADDAYRLLCNRLVELLAYPGLIAGQRAAHPRAAYALLKLQLDMATSYLIFLGEYASTYQRRAERLLHLSTSPGVDAPWDLRDFARRVESATVWKLSLHHLEQPAGPMISATELIAAAHRLWRWEACRLLGSSTSAGDGDLLRAWARRNAVPRAWRGWLWVMRSHRPVPARWHLWLRWLRLSHLGSPRACVYAAALPLLFSSVSLPLDQLETLARWLPQLTDFPGAAAPAPHRLAKEVLWNYHRFLAPTRH